ncbi:winged helix-turn-helix domain-containing protein [Streptomyces sp. NBC_00201]|uniref:ArsR/SmtB family transcription factor n=1 Tax=unclassified Streptomyces TaxID=2593676 RepID=UPI002250ED37|nr:MULTISPECIES: winged helix-turn-helix domain-containing protein [unclassified Streptomyces]MCX5056745.1 winged helix-turn-helix domain-containing protein [Streptomyces sp. NBC_00452]MCX5246333.1 winged helix-turn-helix domain-containing protein [Streptomyces sp. NBC_00201]MCX5287847.1 winged helix-turn-helix domain-containing protein [Streptomyces sp. NBC_00183]
MPEPARQDRHVRHLDARSLRGLAHPLRMQLLDSLRFSGPATASQLAERLGESSGATSYHLRQLAAHGFVEDDPERGKGRERWWRAAVQALDFDESLLTDTSPAVRGAAETYLHEVATTQGRELSTWLGTRQDWSEEWNSRWDMSSWTLRLTPDLTRELVEKMHALVGSYRDLPATENDPQAETVRVQARTFLLPTD